MAETRTGLAWKLDSLDRREKRDCVATSDYIWIQKLYWHR